MVPRVTASQKAYPALVVEHLVGLLKSWVGTVGQDYLRLVQSAVMVES